LKAIALLTAAAVTAASVFEALSSPEELPDVAASQQNQDDFIPITLYRDVAGQARHSSGGVVLLRMRMAFRFLRLHSRIPLQRNFRSGSKPNTAVPSAMGAGRIKVL
jgi:hypothetical protein